MPAVEARGQNLVHLQQFGTVYAQRFQELIYQQLKPLDIINTWSYLEGWLFYHGINPRDVVRGQNSLICKFFSSYQEQQLFRNHLYLDHCKWV